MPIHDPTPHEDAREELVQPVAPVRYKFTRTVYCVLLREDVVDVGRGTPEEVDAAREAWEQSLGSKYAVAFDLHRQRAIGTIVQDENGLVVFCEGDPIPEWARSSIAAPPPKEPT